ncbi:MAG: hypothetical protein PHY48_14950 [Candidatus Cloacimonetes bacterium]|nr:hypothetical protein [Candidatus Cloacimonadota bacterium]
MYYVRDSYQGRRAKILQFRNEQDICIAIFLAAADFEWTIRRIILSLSLIPNKIVREDKRYLYKCSGLAKYKKVWNQLISNIPELITPRYSETKLEVVIQDWIEFEKKYEFRHGIVHGFKSNLKYDEGCKALDTIMQATADIYGFSMDNGYDVYTKVKIVRNTKKGV